MNPRSLVEFGLDQSVYETNMHEGCPNESNVRLNVIGEPRTNAYLGSDHFTFSGTEIGIMFDTDV